MIAVDTNVLIYAHREEMPYHRQALAWLRRLAEGQEPWAIPVFCLGEFIRVVTHRRVFDPPTPLEIALDALDRLLASPACRLLNPGLRYPGLFRHNALEADARGNLAFDAQIVAVCKEHGVTALLSLDRDFSRFSGLTLRSPLEPPPDPEPLPEQSDEQWKPWSLYHTAISEESVKIVRHEAHR